jgi:hypothetical protein
VFHLRKAQSAAHARALERWLMTTAVGCWWRRWCVVGQMCTCSRAVRCCGLRAKPHRSAPQRTAQPCGTDGQTCAGLRRITEPQPTPSVPLRFSFSQFQITICTSSFASLFLLALSCGVWCGAVSECGDVSRGAERGVARERRGAPIRSAQTRGKTALCPSSVCESVRG